MEIKVIRVYLTGSKRIHELYEENQKFLQKQEELRRAVRAQDRQMRGYGKDFEQMLREKELLRAEIGKIKEIYDEVLSERDEWEHRYRESEKARKSLGEKLEHAVGALELLKEREGTPHPSAAQTPAELGTSHASRASGSPQGEGKGAGPCSNYGPLGPMEGGLRI